MNVQMVPQRKGGIPIGSVIPAIILGVLFIGVMLSVMMGLGWVSACDGAVEGTVISMRVNALDAVFRTISFLGGTRVSIGISVVLIVFLAIKKQWKAILFFVIAMAVSIGVCFAIKFGVGRPRPLDFLLDAQLVETEPCFPSGHTWTAVTLFGLMYTILRTYAVNSNKLKGVTIIFLVLAIIWPLVVGFSRLYMGEHYPTDVFGALFGASFFLLLFSGWYFRKFKTGPAKPYSGIGSPDYDPWQSFVAKQEDFMDGVPSDITQIQQPQSPRAPQPAKTPGGAKGGGGYVGRHAR